MRSSRTLAALISTVVVAVLSPALALAAGGPLIPVAADGTVGIESPDGQYRYVTLNGGYGSVVAKVEVGTGEIAAERSVRDPAGGYFGIPQVAGDGSAAGLAGDGSRLVLIRIGPVDQAKLLVLGTGSRLRVLNRITLDGQYSFDAVSPDGRTAYVVEYPRPFRYDRYRVLKLNLGTGRLAKDPVPDEDVGLDEGEAGVAEEMRGLALSQVTSADGRWAYTLYDGGGEVPFIHALDTVGDRAVCAFMPELASLDGKAIRGMRLTSGPDSGSILITDRQGAELASVDTGSFAVTTPSEADADSGSTLPETLAIALAVVVAMAGAAAAVTALRRRRTRKIAPDPEV